MGVPLNCDPEMKAVCIYPRRVDSAITRWESQNILYCFVGRCGSVGPKVHGRLLDVLDVHFTTMARKQIKPKSNI
jgi:hypothetical protein